MMGHRHFDGFPTEEINPTKIPLRQLAFVYQFTLNFVYTGLEVTLYNSGSVRDGSQGQNISYS